MRKELSTPTLFLTLAILCCGIPAHAVEPVDAGSTTTAERPSLIRILERVRSAVVDGFETLTELLVAPEGSEEKRPESSVPVDRVRPLGDTQSFDEGEGGPADEAGFPQIDPNG